MINSFNKFIFGIAVGSTLPLVTIYYVFPRSWKFLSVDFQLWWNTIWY